MNDDVKKYLQALLDKHVKRIDVTTDSGREFIISVSMLRSKLFEFIDSDEKAFYKIVNRMYEISGKILELKKKK